MLSKDTMVRLGLVAPWIVVIGGVVDRMRRTNPNNKSPTPATTAEDDVPVVTSLPDDSSTGIAQVAVEVWRLGRRIDQDPKAGNRIQDSFTRLVRALNDSGVRIEDPISQIFVEGTRADVIDAPPNIDVSSEQLYVSDVLRPAIYVNEICLIPPQVILDRSPLSAKEAT